MQALCRALVLSTVTLLAESSHLVPPEVCPLIADTTFGGGTLEDLYGDSGSTFRGAIGFLVAEGTIDEEPETGFGASIDDMVFMWKEVALDPDLTECAAGACAVVELQSTNFYEGNSVVTVSVLDPTPYGPDGVNDCNGNGSFSDGDDDTDCDNDGTPDVIALATSDNASDIEPLVLNATGGHFYRGDLSVSAAIDVDGTLFIVRNGSQQPTIFVTYDDLDDGSGLPCDNSIDPAESGRIQVSTFVFVPTIDVTVKGFRLDDSMGSGDGDGIADPNEEVHAYLTFVNHTAVDLTDTVARLQTDDPNIDCILTPVVSVGSIPANGVVEAANPFVFHVDPSVSRTSLGEEVTAQFRVTLAGDQFDAVLEAQNLVLDLDLDLTGGTGPTTFNEGFENGLGAFGAIDDNDQHGSNAVSDGFRCQYNDPDFINSNSYGETACFLGGVLPFLNDSYWVLDDPTTRGSAVRAYSGSASLHWGEFIPGDPTGGMDTFGVGQLETIRTSDPVYLSHASAEGGSEAAPELSFKHQISINGFRPNMPVGVAVVQAQEADPQTGAPQGPWRRLSPYQNRHDVQAHDRFVDCYFDPTDDGSTEDDFFDPADPNRREGPSSVCYPNFVFAEQGSTWPFDPFDPEALAGAEGPGLQGETGAGTWVEVRYDLSRYRGRSIRLRFLATTIELDGGVQTFQEWFAANPIPVDDGWWIDDVIVERALISPATLAVDTRSLSEPSPCGDIPCSSVDANLEAVPPGVPAPGHALELNALASTADRCVGGTLQFRFYEDRDNDGTFQPGIDDLVRTWSDNAVAVVAATTGARYTVDVRCSSEPGCADSATVADLVACPGGQQPVGPFPEAVRFLSATRLDWTSAQRADVVRGDLAAVKTSGGFSGTPERLDREPFVPRTGIEDLSVPLPGDAWYYLVRRNACNADGTWGSTLRDQTLP
ncbi:hypothetical protein ABI59_12140 [Acidobacteria bacterium Mor1]|nr:hypothetical protein ABI59_12140 [Acidobacteria bacterium Mor1]